MSQYNSTGNRTGQSRAKGTSRSRTSASQGRKSSSGSRPSSSAGRGGTRTQARRKSSRNRRPVYDYKKIFIGGVILIIAIAVIVFLMKGIRKDKAEAGEPETETTETEETQLQMEVTVDGVTITGMSREEAKSEILKKYSWSLTVAHDGDVYQMTNLMAVKVDELLSEIYAGEPKSSYTLDTTGLEEQIRKEVDVIGERWDKKARNGSISSYDKDTDKFLFTGAQNGYTIDRDKLNADISKAIGAKTFDVSITASGSAVEPEFSEATAREKYKTIGTFTTTTTANNNRNNNIKIASNILNGTILQPGEEFSFNGTVGERTEAKGYKAAAAYNNGLVVDEIGGGVCQVSSTLYNAVVKSGLKTTVRRSHTFEPSYVTPGTDATISWGGPDYKFVNNSSAAIGIRASYGDQKTTISIYGIPVLEEGTTQSLQSKKLKDIDSPAPTYEEDQTLQPEVEKIKNKGSLGSYWETRLVVKKGDQVISQEIIHNTTYKGHTPIILRNTSGVVVTSEGELPTIDSSAPASEGAGDGFTNPGGDTGGEGPQGPTGSGPGITVPTSSASGTNGPETTTKAPTSPASTSAAATTAAPTTAVPTVPGQGPGSSGGDQPQTVAPNPMGGGGQGNPAGPGQ